METVVGVVGQGHDPVLGIVGRTSKTKRRL